MNKEQQIEEMAEIVTTAHNSNQTKLLNEIQDKNIVRESKNPPIAIATALYEAGYRKQSNVVREFENYINTKTTGNEELVKWYNFESNFVPVLSFINYYTGILHKIVKNDNNEWEVAKEFGVEE